MRPAAKEARSATLAARRREPTCLPQSRPGTIETKPVDLRLRDRLSWPPEAADKPTLLRQLSKRWPGG